jgi:ligand-binding sensor domain-containing protein/methyl-accepting chemotaxis protein
MKSVSIRYLLSTTLLLLTIIFNTPAQHSQVNFKEISLSEGLSQSTVFCSLQDSKGFLWFGTRTGGLNKYDGYTFTHYKHDRDDSNTISGNEILCLLEDSNNNIWIGTRNNGLNLFTTETETFTHYFSGENQANSTENTVINDIKEDDLKQLWIGTNSGLLLYNREENTFAEIKDNEGKSFNTIQQICVAKNNTLLIGTKNYGIYLISTKSKKILKNYRHEEDNEQSISSNYITALIYDKDGEIWAGTRDHGLNRINQVNTDIVTRIANDKNNENSLASDIIRTLNQDKQGNIWIGTKNGLEQLLPSQQKKDNPEFIHYQNNQLDKNSLNQNSIYSFLEDNVGDFWIGTWSGGVNHLSINNQKFEYFKYQANKKNGLSHNIVSSFAITKRGLWIGTEETGGLNLYDINNNTFKNIRADINKATSLQSNHIKSLYADEEENLWVGTFNGLHMLKDGSDSFKYFLKGASIYCMEGGAKNDLWIGTSKNLYLLDKDNYQFTTIKVGKQGITNSSINTLLKDSKGNIWIGTKKGLNYFNYSDQSILQFTHSQIDKNTLSNNHITSIREDQEGNIWIGTQDGLNKYNPKTKTFTLFGEKDGLPDNLINNILTDDLGNLWLTTNRGLSRFNIKLAQEKAHNQNLNKIRNFDIGDGLQGNEFITNACYKSRDGRLYFGGVNGFNSFHPEKMKENTNIPKVIITDFQLFNKQVKIGIPNSPLTKNITQTKNLTLTHKQSVITFGFVALNFKSSEKNRYAYYMEGFDKNWIEAGTKREASYTNLPADDYVFRVKASNNDGIWNEEGTYINITILPPWWEAWWFRTLCITFVATIIIGYSRYRTKKLKENQKKLEQEVKIATEEVKNKNAKLEEAQVKLSSIMTDVKKELGKASVELLDATNSQASTIQQISTSIEQMTREINDNATNAVQMFNNAQNIEKDTEDSVGIVTETVTSIENITQGIGYISEFARTTNLLSLNAAIEAAKAGVHGRAFSVVANEVKKLADQSQEMAINIKNLSESGLTLSHEAKLKIHELQEYISGIVGLIAQIRESSENQSHEASNINEAVQQILSYVNRTAQLAEKLDTAINSLSVDV